MSIKSLIIFLVYWYGVVRVALLIDDVDDINLVF
jgi:hypothetical protein